MFVVILVVLAIAVAGCGSGGGPPGTAAPGGSPAATEDASTELTCGDAPPENPAGGAVDRDAVRAALEVQNLRMQLLLQATSDDRWKALLNPANPIRLDARAYSEAVETIATLPGVSGVIGTFREIATQSRMAAASGRPYGDGSGIGESLNKLASENFVTAQAELSRAWEATGCK